MDFFMMMGVFGGGFDDYDGYGGHNRYAGRPDKSAAAKARERECRDKFDYLKAQMDVAIYENTMTMLALGRKGASESCLRHLSDDMFAQVLDFAGVKKPSGSTVKLFASRRPTETNEIIPLVGYSSRPPRAKNPPTMNLADSTLFEAGAKISIEMSQPDLHITGPCWTTLLKHAKQNGWNLKRVAATQEEKKAYRQTRKGQVYFINAVYSVPVTKYPGKKPLYLKPPGGKKSGSKKRKSSSGGGQKKPAAKKRAAPTKKEANKKPPANEKPPSSKVINVADLVPKDRQEHGAASDVNLRVLAATMVTGKAADVAESDDDLKMPIHNRAASGALKTDPDTNKMLKSDK